MRLTNYYLGSREGGINDNLYPTPHRNAHGSNGNQDLTENIHGTISLQAVMNW